MPIKTLKRVFQTDNANIIQYSQKGDSSSNWIWWILLIIIIGIVFYMYQNNLIVFN